MMQSLIFTSQLDMMMIEPISMIWWPLSSGQVITMQLFADKETRCGWRVWAKGAAMLAASMDQSKHVQRDRS